VNGVTSADFSRSYDGISSGCTDPQYKALVSDFRLDKYEATVGRFRKFVDATIAGWTPGAHTGKHTYLNGASGLQNGAGGYETGWDPSWSAYVPSTKSDWDGATQLACEASATWTPSAAGNENRPINCVNWYEAYAFCLWDGGFLPSESEWNYAASGGIEQRVYPWSVPPSLATVDVSYASYGCLADGLPSCTTADLVFVGTKPKGNGKYGHSDLLGNVYEWNLDAFVSPYNETTCTNCTYDPSSGNRVLRGGCFFGGAGSFASNRFGTTPGENLAAYGVRCARIP
jgi:formylglycine-generating enzyme required for sulfatase activity